MPLEFVESFYGALYVGAEDVQHLVDDWLRVCDRREVEVLLDQFLYRSNDVFFKDIIRKSETFRCTQVFRFNIWQSKIDRDVRKNESCWMLTPSRLTSRNIFLLCPLDKGHVTKNLW